MASAWAPAAGHTIGSRWVPRSNISNYSNGHSHLSCSRGKCAAIRLHGPAHQRQRRGVSATGVILNKASDSTVANSVSRRTQYPLGPAPGATLHRSLAFISVGVTPQSSPDICLTQSVKPSVSAAAPRLEQTGSSKQTRGDGRRQTPSLWVSASF